MRFATIAKSMYKGWKVRKRTSMKKIIIAVAVIAGILAAVAIISILAQTPMPI